MFVYTLSQHVFFPRTTGPALCKPAASVASIISLLCFGVPMCLAHVTEQLHWAVTEESQSPCTTASILWLDLQLWHCSVRSLDPDSGKAGRRASVLQQALLSAYLRSAKFMRRAKSRYAVNDVRTRGLRVMRPTRCQPRYQCPVHLPDSPMLGSKGLITMEHGKPNLS
jgi:hypothetical protein